MKLLIFILIPLISRYWGNPTWKKYIKSKIGIFYSKFFVASLLLPLFYTASSCQWWTSLLVASILTISFLVLRYRSPRGANFILTGGRAGVPQPNNGFHWYNGKQNKISKWLTEFITKYNFDRILRHRKKQKLHKYGLVYATVHNTWAMLIIACVTSLVTQNNVIYYAAFGLVTPICYYISGVNGPWKKELGSRGRVELIEGALVYAPFLVLNIV